MAVIWKEEHPALYSGDVWAQWSELAENVSASFSVEVTNDDGVGIEPRIVSLHAKVEPDGVFQTSTTFSGSEGSGMYSAETLSGIFSPIFLEYLGPDKVPGRVSNWVDVPPPEEAPDFIEYRPHRRPYLDVVATATLSTDRGETSSMVRKFRIVPDWSAGRAKLIELIEERRYL